MVQLLRRQWSAQRNIPSDFGTPDISGAQVNSTTANIKGAPKSCFSSCPHAQGMILHYGYDDTIAFDTYLLDIGFTTDAAAPGSAEWVVENMMFWTTGSSALGAKVWVPIQVQKGAELWMRQQSDHVDVSGIHDMYMFVEFVREGEGQCRGYQRSTTLGADTSDTTGTNVNASVGSFGSWVDFGSAAHPIKWLTICHADNGNVSFTNGFFLLQIAAADSAPTDDSTTIIDSHSWQTSGRETISPMAGGYPVDVPASKKLWIRVASDIANTDRHQDYVLVGYG